MYQQLIAEKLKESSTFSHVANFNFILDGKTHWEKKEGEYNFYYCGSIQSLEGDPSKEVLTLTVKNWQDEYEFLRIPLFELNKKDEAFFANATKFYKEKAVKELTERNPKALEKAEEYISKVNDVPSNTCAYLKKKKLDKLKGYEFLIDTGSHNEIRKLVLPIWQFNEETKEFKISSYQTITTKNKLFQKGGKVESGLALVSKNNKLLEPETITPSHPILIAEGFATGLSISYALDFPVFIAFSGGNISKLAALLRKHNRNKPILIFADDDAFKAKNTGLEAARKAARESKCCYILPDFTGVVGWREDKLTDFDDLSRKKGFEKIQAQYNTFNLIKPSEALRTEHTGFYKVYNHATKGGALLEKAKPCYDDLVKFFERQNPFINLAGNKDFIEIFNGTYWESKHVDFLGEFVKKHMFDPLTYDTASDVNIKKFKEELKSTNVEPLNYFSNTNSKVVCLRNGVYDFDSHTLHKHSPRFPVRFCLDYDYDVEATCPKFLEVLERVLPSKTHKEQQDLLLEFLGWALSGDKYWTAGFIYLKGEGSNGKSTILQLMRSLFHGESKQAFSLNDLARKDSLEQLKDAFVNICEETSEKKFLSSNILKQITDHGITNARALYKASVNFENRCKFIFSGNKFPIISDRTKGMMRRLMFIDFSQDVSKYKKELDIVEQLKKERSGIFNLAMSKYREAKERKYFSKPSQELMSDFKEFNKSLVQEFMDGYDFCYIEESKQDIQESDFYLKPDFLGYASFSKRPYLIINEAYKAAMKIADDMGRSRNSQNKFTSEFKSEFLTRFGVKLERASQRHKNEPVPAFKGVGIKRKEYH